MENFLEIKGRRMNTIVMGDADTNLVILSGSGVSFPKFEYMALMQALSEHYKVILIEKFGYGFSDNTEEDRIMDVVVEEYRSALQLLNIKAPVLLFGHSMGFIEACRWAQSYPEEVSGLFGLDAATPECYQDFDIEKALEGLYAMAADTPMKASFADVILGELGGRFPLTEDEQARYRTLLVQNLANRVWISEAKHLRDSVALVQAHGLIRKPTLLFVSNGEGTGLSTEVWRKHPLNYIKQIENGEYRLFDHPHTLNNYVPQEMADELHDFVTRQITG